MPTFKERVLPFINATTAREYAETDDKWLLADGLVCEALELTSTSSGRYDNLIMWVEDQLEAAAPPPADYAIEGSHFFATSAGEWKVDTDLPSLIKYFDKAGLYYVIWMVPCHVKAEYPVQWYAPQVEGAVQIAEGCRA
jgi:hypothetical protein